MSRGFTYKVKGLEQVLRNIEKVERKVAENIDRELSEAARNVARNAAIDAPGSLAQAVKADTSTKYNKSVRVGVFYAPYIEFGTGKKVFDSSKYQFSKAEKEYARQFYVSGKGKTKSNPYLFPAYTEELGKLIHRIKKVLFG